jgi:hypothetical protein
MSLRRPLAVAAGAALVGAVAVCGLEALQALLSAWITDSMVFPVTWLRFSAPVFVASFILILFRRVSRVWLWTGVAGWLLSYVSYIAAVKFLSVEAYEVFSKLAARFGFIVSLVFYVMFSAGLAAWLSDSHSAAKPLREARNERT